MYINLFHKNFNIDNNQYTGTITLDITKAFDTVCLKTPNKN